MGVKMFLASNHVHDVLVCIIYDLLQCMMFK